MRFNEWVRETREAKKKHDPVAYTQSACGSRMLPDPITQEGWSRYENRETRPDYDTVIAIADALGVSREEALKVAGYDVRKHLRIEASEYVNGEERPVHMTPEKEAELKRKVEALDETLQDLKRLLISIPC